MRIVISVIADSIVFSLTGGCSQQTDTLSKQRMSIDVKDTDIRMYPDDLQGI